MNVCVFFSLPILRLTQTHTAHYSTYMRAAFLKKKKHFLISLRIFSTGFVIKRLTLNFFFRFANIMFHTHFWLFISVCVSHSLSFSLSLYVSMCIRSYVRVFIVHVEICFVKFGWEKKKPEAIDSETRSGRKRDGKRKLVCAFTYRYYIYNVWMYVLLYMWYCARFLSFSFFRSHLNMCTFIVVALLVIRFSIKNNILSIYFMCSVQTYHTKWYVGYVCMCVCMCVISYMYSVFSAEPIESSCPYRHSICIRKNWLLVAAVVDFIFSTRYRSYSCFRFYFSIALSCIHWHHSCYGGHFSYSFTIIQLDLFFTQIRINTHACKNIDRCVRECVLFIYIFLILSEKERKRKTI